MAQITRGLHRKLKEQGFTMVEIRDELRKAYADHPELYELARERERLHPGLLRYRGNTGDLRQRYTLRVMIYETDKLTEKNPPQAPVASARVERRVFLGLSPCWLKRCSRCARLSKSSNICRKEKGSMARATKTVKQALSYRSVHAAWFAATQALF